MSSDKSFGHIYEIHLAGQRLKEKYAHDEIVRVRGLGGGDNLGFARADAAERDIAADAAAEELGLNEHELLNWVFLWSVCWLLGPG